MALEKLDSHMQKNETLFFYIINNWSENLNVIFEIVTLPEENIREFFCIIGLLEG